MLGRPRIILQQMWEMPLSAPIARRTMAAICCNSTHEATFDDKLRRRPGDICRRSTCDRGMDRLRGIAVGPTSARHLDSACREPINTTVENEALPTSSERCSSDLKVRFWLNRTFSGVSHYVRFPPDSVAKRISDHLDARLIHTFVPFGKNDSRA